ncbi:MAG: serine hydrolase [Desulfobacula sp.]|jgi:CubicO group peptidase (beta-lactamase class C family)
MKRKIKWMFGIVFLCVMGFGVYFLDGALPIGTGYSAKYICSQVFLAGKNPEQVFEKDVKPTHALFQVVRPVVDVTNKMVTAAAFGFWKPMTAVYREGCGCTLIVDTDRDKLKSQMNKMSLYEFKRSDETWPRGEGVELEQLPGKVNREKLKKAVDEAFTEPGPDTERNTRAIVVVLGDRIIAEQYAPGNDKDTPMHGWSMSKSVTNSLVGILVKEKGLNIHAPAQVAAWKDQGDPRHKITLDMMLRMSSGLEFEEVYGPFKDATYMLYTAGSMADYAAAKPLAADPDTQWNYSSGTANIIARMVTDQVGGSLAGYHKFAKEYLFNKIGAYSAVIEPDASGSFVGSSYMFATARDWARFGLFLKNKGVWNNEKILPDDWMGYSTRPTPKAPMGEYGALFWLNAGEKDNPDHRKFPSLPKDLYYCGGFNGQIVAVIPSRDMVVVRLGVTHDKSWSHETFIRQVLDSIEAD